jgi:hypothetical protein
VLDPGLVERHHGDPPAPSSLIAFGVLSEDIERVAASGGDRPRFMFRRLGEAERI